MRKIICCLMAVLCLLGAACAEEASSAIAVIPAAPEITAAPMGETFSSEDLIVTLPYGLSILLGDDFAGYEAALQADFPDSGRMLLAAVNAECTAALSFSIAENNLSAADFAAEAAKIILGDSAAVSEIQYGANSYASFSCGIGEDIFRLFFLSGENRMLVIGASGIAEAEIEAMLSGLNF